MRGRVYHDHVLLVFIHGSPDPDAYTYAYRNADSYRDSYRNAYAYRDAYRNAYSYRNAYAYSYSYSYSYLGCRLGCKRLRPGLVGCGHTKIWQHNSICRRTRGSSFQVF